MKHSPLLYSCTLIASLSLLNIGSAWSAPESQEKPATAAGVKAKTIKAKAHKAKTSKAKTAHKPAPVKVVSTDNGKSVPLAASVVTTNPYLASQPLVIPPKAVNPYLANRGISAPVVSAPVVSAPVVSAPVVSAPVVSAPVVSAPVAATPVTAQKAAATPTSAPMAAYQAWNIASDSKNPYLVYQRPYTPPDPTALFNQFGNGLKISWPSFPQPANSTPWINTTGSSAMANPAQSAITDATNSFNQIFTSLKMALPSFQQPIVNPSQTAIAGTSNSFNQMFTSLKSVLPSLPSGDTTLLPVIKTVYPTGDKPLVILNFKCPTEMLGVSPPPMKLLHEAVNLGFDGLNKTNLLSFNLQQVCS